MYYRVKKFSETYNNMFVLDKDLDINNLKSRVNIDCAGIGYKSFSNPILLESQQVRCVSLGGTMRDSDIIKDL
jgi:hypothetical protein